MGQHKYNPTAIAAKAGELPPKPKKMSKAKRDKMLRKKIQDATGITELMAVMGKPYLYM